MNTAVPSPVSEGTMTIRYAIGTSSLGLVLIAATEKGICCVMFGDAPDELVSELRDRFPKTEIVEGDAGTAEVIELIERPTSHIDVPLDIRGTPFQTRVWDALRRIPFGRTATYADIAKAIGAPTSMRAVAQACGANHISVLIPCHRVIRTDGSLSGYRWGVERKKELLRREVF